MSSNVHGSFRSLSVSSHRFPLGAGISLLLLMSAAAPGVLHAQATCQQCSSNNSACQQQATTQDDYCMSQAENTYNLCMNVAAGDYMQCQAECQVLNGGSMCSAACNDTYDGSKIGCAMTWDGQTTGCGDAEYAQQQGCTEGYNACVNGPPHCT